MEENNKTESTIVEEVILPKIALELDNNNVIIGTVFLASQDYTQLLQDNPNLVVAECGNIDDIIEYKTKYENGQFFYTEDYTQEYYDNLHREEQRQAIETQLQALYEWFNEYDNQIKQYERDMRLGCAGTYHIGDTTYSIAELDQEATQKAQQISNLRQQLKNIQ